MPTFIHTYIPNLRVIRTLSYVYVELVQILQGCSLRMLRKHSVIDICNLEESIGYVLVMPWVFYLPSKGLALCAQSCALPLISPVNRMGVFQSNLQKVVSMNKRTPVQTPITRILVMGTSEKVLLVVEKQPHLHICIYIYTCMCILLQGWPTTSS